MQVADPSFDGAVQSTIGSIKTQVASDFAKVDRISQRIKHFSGHREEAAGRMEAQMQLVKAGLDELLGDAGQVNSGQPSSSTQHAAVVAERLRLQERSKAAEAAKKEAEVEHASLERMVNNFGEARQTIEALNNALEHDPAQQKAYFHMPGCRAGVTQPPLVCTRSK